MPFRTNNIKPAGIRFGDGRFFTCCWCYLGGLASSQNDLSETLDLGFDLLDFCGFFCCINDVSGFLPNAHIDIAAKFDVRAPARHIGGNGDCTWNPSFGDDKGFLFVKARVQHGKLAVAFAGTRSGIKPNQSIGFFKIDLLKASLAQPLGKQF